MKCMIIAVALSLLATFSARAEDIKVPYDSLEVEWAPRQNDKKLLSIDPSLGFDERTRLFCPSYNHNPNQADDTASRGQKFLSSAVTGIVVDWIASTIVSAAKDRALRRVAEYSESYSNTPAYDEAFVFADSTTGDICVTAKRITCMVNRSDVLNGTASCVGASDRSTAFSIGIVLHPEAGNRVRVLPYAWSLAQLKPQHAREGENAAVSVRFQLDGLTNDPSNGGKKWTSGQAPIVTFSCPIKKDRTAVDGACEWGLNPSEVDALWSSAPVMPLPPRTVAAPVFTVAEVGQPGRGLKLYAKFLEDKKDDISAVLADAMKKKLDLAE